MGARSRDHATSISVLVAWDGPDREAAAARVTADAIRHSLLESGDDIRSGLRVGLAVADRRLRTSPLARRARSAPAGIGAAVVAGESAWTAAQGAVDIHLLRDGRMARLGAAAGPRPVGGAADGPSPDQDPVVRISLVHGDTLLFTSRDLLRELGPEELKSAALTLHPATAAQHLRRLFATAGGRGSDAALAIDVVLPAPAGRAARPVTDEPLVGAAERSASPVTPARRAALGFASFASVVAIVALVVVVLPGGGERVSAQEGPLDAAVVTATDRLTRAENVAASDPSEAVDLYLDAWAALEEAADPDAVGDGAVTDLAGRIRAGLDAARGGGIPKTRTVTTFEAQATDPQPGSLVRGPEGDLYFIDRVAAVVTRVDADDGSRSDVVHRGDRSTGRDGRIGRPVQLESAGETLLIVDDRAGLWRWRASDDRDGTLTALDLGADDEWSSAIGDVETYPDPNGFRVYVVDPLELNIIRYQPGFDGRSFTRSEYLVSDDAVVKGFRQLHIDERVFALGDDGIRRYEFGRAQHFRTDAPPDDDDVRPGQAYRLIAGTDRPGMQGHLYLYDEVWDRILVFDKGDGRYVRQWVSSPGDASMDAMLGLAVTTGPKKRPDTLHWLTAAGVFEAVVPATAAQAARAADEDAGRSPKDGGRRKGRSR
jgi:hypothetical protein